MSERICELCGKLFIPHKGQSKYCSSICLIEAEDIKAKERYYKKKHGICPVCGKEFKRANDRQTHCSITCKLKETR